MIICLNNGSSTIPLILSSSILNATSSVNSYVSSTQQKHNCPTETEIDVIFNGSSKPLNKIFCPVGLYVISSGLSFNSQ